MPTAAPAPDDFADPATYAEPTQALDALHVPPAPVDAALARKLEDWFTASAPGPVPALPESVSRFVPKGQEEPPLHRWRLVEGGFVERWTAVERRVNSFDLRTIALLAGQDRVIGWNVVRLPLPPDARASRIVIEGEDVIGYDGFGRRVALEPQAGEAFRQRLLTLHLAPEDDATYNGFYPTLPGNDIAHYRDAKPEDGWRSDMAEHQGGEPIRNASTEDGYVRGGREIRGGRAEHREATKGMIHYDAGYVRDVERIQREKKAAQQAQNRQRIAQTIALGPERENEV